MLLFTELRVFKYPQNKQEDAAITATLDTLQQNLHIVWDSSSLIRLSTPVKAAFYSLMIQLNNEALLLAFAP